MSFDSAEIGDPMNPRYAEVASSSASKKKQESKSTKHYIRKRTLKRGSSYEPFREEHIKYVWAAYARGMLPDIEAGLKAEEFKLKMLKWAADAIETGNDIYVLLGQTRHGNIPVGVVTLGVITPSKAVVQYQPHVNWLPEATPRNKLECTLRFLVDLKKEGNIVIIARREFKRFFDHVSGYGVLRPLGHFRKYYETGEDALIYQGVN